MIRVLLVDDQTLVRQGIRGLLELGEGVDVAAEAADGEEGLAAVQRERPDVVLLDLRMPRYDGIWMLEAMRERGVDVPVLVLTTFDDDALVLAALRAGARGYLLKDVTLEQLLGAVGALAEGDTFVQPGITERVVRAVRGEGGGSSSDSLEVASEAAPAGTLTQRELEVLRLVAGGYSNREIAQALFLAEGTVKNHISATLLKLGARDRTSAVLRALREGLIG